MSTFKAALTCRQCPRHIEIIHGFVRVFTAIIIPLCTRRLYTTSMHGVESSCIFQDIYLILCWERASCYPRYCCCISLMLRFFCTCVVYADICAIAQVLVDRWHGNEKKNEKRGVGCKKGGCCVLSTSTCVQLPLICILPLPRQYMYKPSFFTSW